MSTRAHALVVASLVLLAGAPGAWADDEPKKPKPQTDSGPTSGRRPPAPSPTKPPSIAYGGTRSSSTWVETPSGARVAVGKGVSFQGVKVYLSLLWDLVGVDEASGKTLYAANIGAFWNAFGFKEISVSGSKVWAVELRPGARARVGKDKRQYHDLRTGKTLVPDGQTKPNLGAALKPAAVWHGAASRVGAPVHRLVSTQANWDALRTRMFGAKPKQAFAAIDFTKNVVIVTSSGDSWNTDGFSVEAAYENATRVLIRMRRHAYQTDGGGNRTRPYGVFVLPRRPGKAYVLERNSQGLIRGPALWRETYRTQIGKPAAELKGLPAAGPRKQGLR